MSSLGNSIVNSQVIRGSADLLKASEGELKVPPILNSLVILRSADVSKSSEDELNVPPDREFTGNLKIS